MTRRKFAALFALAMLAAPLAAPLAVRAQEGGILVAHAWSRPAAAGRVGVAYFAIATGGPADRLVGLASPIADRAELHESYTEGGVSKMRAVDGLAIEPGKMVALAPGGYHVMLVGLKRALKPGDTFPLTLTFAHAAPLTTTVEVRVPAGDGRAAQGNMGTMPGMGGHDMGAMGGGHEMGH
jgi:copper(I)-binding protein